METHPDPAIGVCPTAPTYAQAPSDGMRVTAHDRSREIDALVKRRLDFAETTL
jgi:hypothetical protein